jgi:hypothetical protein
LLELTFLNSFRLLPPIPMWQRQVIKVFHQSAPKSWNMKIYRCHKVKIVFIVFKVGSFVLKYLLYDLGNPLYSNCRDLPSLQNFWGNLFQSGGREMQSRNDTSETILDKKNNFVFNLTVLKLKNLITFYKVVFKNCYCIKGKDGKEANRIRKIYFCFDGNKFYLSCSSLSYIFVG